MTFDPSAASTQQAAANCGTPLAAILADRIRQFGPITFAEFMDACLYHPEHGYYTRPQQGSAADGSEQTRGDFFTSVDVHPVFGRLLARQLAEMWERLERPAQFTAVECGAGSGALARHILDFAAKALPQFYPSLRYVAVERSAARRALQAENLAAHVALGNFTTHEALPERVPAGCIFSNELLDAFPVHRVVQRSEGLREVFVDWKQGKFADALGEPSTPRLGEYFAEQGITLLDDAQAEASLAANDWIATVGQALERGYILTVDYGHDARELYNEHHARGTLLAYHQHRATEDYYARPGEQDLTAHVNFTALDIAGRRAGLQRLGLVSQSHFLLALGRANEFADVYDEGMSELDRTRARLHLKTLINPEGMGETFHVLVQAKGVDTAKTLTGLCPL